MAFTHVQGNSVNQTSAVLTFNLVLANNPAQGNLVCVALMISNAGITSLTCVDGNGNAYTQSPNSPSFLLGGAAEVYLFYLLKAPANASKTITFTWATTTTAPQAWADEFSINTAGSIVFDKDIVSPSAQGPNGTINTPTITPTNANSLLYAAAATTGTITAPTAGAMLGSWTGSGGAIQNGNMAEYDLSASSGTAVQFTQSSSNTWSAAAMAFYSHLPGHIQLEGGTGNVELEDASGDIALEY